MEVLTSARPEVRSYTIPCAEAFHFDDESWLAKPAAFSQHDAAALRKIAACFITNRTNGIISIQNENRNIVLGCTSQNAALKMCRSDILGHYIF